MKISKNPFIIVLASAMTFAFCLSSCEDFFETTIEVETPDALPKIVVNTFLQPEQDSIGIYVGSNLPLSSTEASVDFERINADITIENLTNGSTITAQYREIDMAKLLPYNYVNTNIDQSYFNNSDEYLFTISDIAGQYPTVTTQATFPTKSIIKTTDYEYEGGIREDGDQASSFTITFDDPAGENNFYEVAIIRGYDPSRNFNRVEYTSTIDLAATKGFENDYVLLSDESFDGQEKTLELKIFRKSNDDFKFSLLWRDISEDYFRYSKTLNTQSNLGDNPFASIAPVYTNVENGLGIVSLYQEQIIPMN